MLKGFVLPSRRASASAQHAALEAAGVQVRYEEGKTEGFDDLLRSLRRGDGVAVRRLSDLGNNRRELRTRLDAIHKKNSYLIETATKRDSRKPNDLRDMIFDAADDLGQSGKGRDPAIARKNGAKGGRPRIDRKVTDEEAERHWFDMRHATNADAIKHMGRWNVAAAWRKWGASGRKTGPRRPDFAKRKPK
ncbi:transposon gammA-delta resolvasE [Caudoviricetes sp.]|nr:transposon gammA-delta resolvasE [Caudoviricetes sp.]